MFKYSINLIIQMLMFTSLGIILLLFIFGYVITINYQIIKWYSFRLVNCIVDLYLIYKYRDFQYQNQNKPYYMTKIMIVPIAHPEQFTIIQFNHDLRKSSIQIKQDDLRLYWDSHQTVIFYIYFIYDQFEYILPSPYVNGGIIELPLYDSMDLDTCFKNEYINVETQRYTSETMDHADHADLLTLINQYAGPKGNFYSDTQFQFSPNLIRDTKGHFLLEGEMDFLKITSMMGEMHIFLANQTIVM